MYADFRNAIQKAQELEAQGQLEAARQQHEAAAQLASQARELFEKNLAGFSSDSNVSMEYAELLSWHGDVDLAAEVLEKAVKRKTASADMWLALGRALTDLGPAKRTQAKEALEKAISLADSAERKIEALTVLTVFYWEIGLFDAAHEELQVLEQEKADHVPSRIIRAAFAIREGKIKEASEQLDSLGNLNAAQTILLNKLIPRALDDFELSGKPVPDEAESHAAYAKILIRANRAEQSLLPLERAVRLNSQNYVYWNMLGSVAQFHNRPERARQAYQRSLEIYPDQPRIREALQSLDQASSASSSQN